MKLTWLMCTKLLGVGAISLFSASLCSQQPEPRGLRQGGFDIRKVWRTPGELVSQGSNETPVGKLKVKTYRLERVKLEPPYETADGQTFAYAYKLIVTGGPFSSTHLLWVNDQAVAVLPQQDQHELVAVLLANGFSWDGAVLSISLGADPCSFVEGSETLLPDRLSIPAELRSEQRTPHRIRLRSIPSEPGLGGKPAVEVIVTMDHTDLGRNEPPAIQLGKKSFWAGAISGNEILATVPYEEFAKVPDNSQVIVKWGRCQIVGTVAGVLNKSSVDR